MGRQSAHLDETIKLEAPAIGSTSMQDTNLLMKKKTSQAQKGNF